MDEAQAGIKIARRNINNSRYATLIAEGEEDLKSLLMKVKEKNEKAVLKLNIQKMKIILLFLRLHPANAFQALLLTLRVTPFLLRDFCPQ